MKIEFNEFTKPVRASWHDSERFGFEQEMVSTPGNLKNTFECLELLEIGWNLKFDFSNFEKFFGKIRVVYGARVSCPL